MPNWCDNTITVRGKAVDIKRFDEQFGGEYTAYYGSSTSIRVKNIEQFKKEHENCEYKIIPYSNMFETEKGKEKKVDINILTKEKKCTGYSFNNFIEMTKEDFLNGWYNWSCNNWGTKWDVSNVNRSGLDLLADAEEDDEIEVVYWFNTAWSPCSPVVAAMSEQFPTLEFEHSYEECGCCYAGKDTYQEGECIESLEADGTYSGYKNFLHEHMGREYYKCAECGELLEDWDFEEDECCPECNSKRIYEYDGETLVEFEDE